MSLTMRFDININEGHRNLLLVGSEEEPLEHMALRLTAALIFWELQPIIPPGHDHPAIVDLGYVPDFLCVDEAGGVAVWGECGAASTNKMGKAVRKYGASRIVAFHHSLETGRRYRETLKDDLRTPSRVDILAWRQEDFRPFVAALTERNYIVGQSFGHSINLVLNDQVFDSTLELL